MKTIIFDLGETLIYFRDIKVVGNIENPDNPCINKTLNFINNSGDKLITRDNLVAILKKIREERHSKSIEIGLDKLVDRLVSNFNIEPKLREGIINSFSETFFELAYVDSYAIQVLGTLKRFYKLGIISNSPFGIDSKYAIAVLKKFKIYDYFNFMTFSYDMGIRKPDLEIFTKTIDRNSLVKEDIIYVGNSETEDIEAAIKFGIKKTVLIKQKDNPTAGGILLENLPNIINSFNTAVND